MTLLVVTETTGALSPTFDRALRALGKHARAPTTHDSNRYTLYGLSRSSPRAFLAHHRAAISAAVVLADATTILLAAPAMSFNGQLGGTDSWEELCMYWTNMQSCEYR